MTLYPCPHCKGEGGWLGPVDCVAPYEHEEMEDCGCPRSWSECWTCRGKRQVDGIQRAVYLARGGPAPIPFQGYA